MNQSDSPAYFAIIPANVRYDKNLCANAKLLYGEITALTQKEGYCWASNRYFANLYNVDIRTINRWIANLEKCEYIQVDHETRGANDVRKIGLKNIVPPMTKMSYPHDKNVIPPGHFCPAYNKEEKDKEKNNNNKCDDVVVSEKEKELVKERLTKAQKTLAISPVQLKKIERSTRNHELLLALEEHSSKWKTSRPKNPAGAFIEDLRLTKELLREKDVDGELDVFLKSCGFKKVIDNNCEYWVK